MLESCSKEGSLRSHTFKPGLLRCFSVPRRQMTSATAQGRKGGRRQAGGQRVLVMSKPLFWSLDNLLHPQEVALTAAIFLFFGKNFCCRIRLKSSSPNQNHPMMAVPPVRKWSCQGGPVGSEGQKRLFCPLCLLIFEY